jgi:hypothetical protein
MGVFFQQGRHRCVLTGTGSGRPEEEAEEDAMWTACAEWANFEPQVARPKTHKEVLLFMEGCTHFFEGNEQILHDLSGTQVYQEASQFRKELIEGEAPPRAIGYVTSAASSRRFQVEGGGNYWLSGSPSFAPPAVTTPQGTSPRNRYQSGLAGNGGDVIIIVIHLLGLAPAGYSTAPDNGA